ncbi:helix-turn-helix transcriptional regulator [Oceanobacillus iheyensis]|uniref:helix-turn-helix transcriptional regulator n=1 Tax=Oceanobacillus iheyensis TaxID=182710 RepID=UPI00363E68AC
MINRVKLTRMEKNLTQQQLAARTGITRQTVGLIEKGQYNPSLQLCIKIAKELGVTLNDLFWEENNS